MSQYAGKKFWEHKAFLLDGSRLIPTNRRSAERRKIEAHVLKWLKDDTGEESYSFQVSRTSGGHIQFSKSEIYIKSALNMWEVWRIATSPRYPKMISYKVKNVGTNQGTEGFILPNEVRSCTYDDENRVWNLFSEVTTDEV